MEIWRLWRNKQKTDEFRKTRVGRIKKPNISKLGLVTGSSQGQSIPSTLRLKCDLWHFI